MTDYDEEQAMEVEALEAIFGEDYEELSSSAPRQVRLKLMPVPGVNAGDENKVIVLASFSFPETYPEVLPEVVVEPVKGLTAKHCEELKKIALEEAENLVGTPMVFSLAEQMKDWLVENNRDHTDESMHAQMVAKQEAEVREREAEENAAKKAAQRLEEDSDEDDDKPRVVDGTPVTKESFTEWYVKFAAEVKAREEEELGDKRLTPSQRAGGPDAFLTGREYFEHKRLGTLPSSNTGQDAKPINDDEADEEWDADIQEDLFLEEEVDDLDDLASDSDGSDDDDDDDKN
eukprot:CAMPEP_0184525434 /NCGR_PEP_ID=MMETSP0198_2-20121128/10095_1 /TAXON_ID=1112570 /ORGANISM="Thraustochytrium sp., Strain LLF1b" /LENGTH=288 /DNA_ID=CAMNT_0026916891 /DNA_START=27 /DNA_END=893 /DNA_ORIENTATION=+